MHHGTIQVVSPSIKDHAEIHIELMNEMLKIVGFSKTAGDKLFYVEGTESHTLTVENYIGKELGAEIAYSVGKGNEKKEYYAFPELKIDLNGKHFWYTHHGAPAGGGANEGDSYRNWLKRVYWDCKKQGRKVPDLICSAHYHKSIKQSYEMDYHVLHGIITPSWQKKTRFGIRVAPFEKN